MSTYAVAHKRKVNLGPEIVEYLQRIDGTLKPFGGRFLVHSGELETLEGSWPGDLIVIEFPDRERARTWYGSPAHQEFLRLRTDNSDGDVVLAEGVSDGHRATDVLAASARPDLRVAPGQVESGRRRQRGRSPQRPSVTHRL